MVVIEGTEGYYGVDSIPPAGELVESKELKQ
jgi:hypothetical protein